MAKEQIAWKKKSDPRASGTDPSPFLNCGARDADGHQHFGRGIRVALCAALEGGALSLSTAPIPARGFSKNRNDH
jgi:hypothetical protein